MGLKVTSIVDVGAFEVFPPWRWEGKSGIMGMERILSVVRYFERLLIGVYRKYLGVRRGRLYLSTESIMERGVKLKNKKKVDCDKLVCDVHADWRNVADYLPH